MTHYKYECGELRTYEVEMVRSNYTEKELLKLNSKSETARTLSKADKDYLKEIAERKRKENLTKKNLKKKKK